MMDWLMSEIRGDALEQISQAPVASSASVPSHLLPMEALVSGALSMKRPIRQLIAHAFAWFSHDWPMALADPRALASQEQSDELYRRLNQITGSNLAMDEDPPPQS